MRTTKTEKPDAKPRSHNAAPSLCAVIFLLLLGSGMIDSQSFAGGDPYLSVIVLELLIFALPALFFCRLRGRGYAKRMRLRPFEPGALPFILLASIALIFTTCTVKLGLITLYGSSLDSTVGGTAAAQTSSGLPAILAFAVFPAVTEETVFRGIMLAEYDDCGAPAAVIFSSLFFAMLHFDLPLFPVYFVSGVILAVTAYACRSLFAPLIVHAVNNVFGLLFEDYIWSRIFQPRNTVVFTFLAVSLTLLSLSLMFGEAARLYRGYGSYGEDSSYAPARGERTPLVYAVTTVPFAVCFLIYILAVLL